MVRVGIVGYGAPAKIFHIPMIEKAGLTISAFSSSRPDAVKADYPAATIHSTPSSLFADPDVDLIVIASPSPTHAPLMLEAIEAGKHVISDKPFCHTVEEANRLIEARDRHGVIATVYQNRRFDSDFLTFSKLIRDGELGKIHTFRGYFEFYAPVGPDAPNRRTEPVQYGLGTHQVDQVVTLFGKPDWVWGELRHIEKGENPDYMQAVLGYDNGAHAGLRVELVAGFTQADHRARYAIHGDKGSYVKEFMDCQEEQLHNGIGPDNPAFGREPEDRYAQLTRVLADGSVTRETVPSIPGDWTEIYRALGEALRGEGNPIVTLEEARDVIEIISRLPTR